MLNCRDVTARATEYLEGTLSWRARLQFRFHLALCRFCRRYVEQLRLTIRAVGGLGPLLRRDAQDAARAMVEQVRASMKGEGR